MQLTDDDNLFQTILAAPIGICILEASTLRAEIVNDKFLEIAGKPREAIIGKWYWDAFAEVKHDYEKALAQVVSTGEAFYANEVELTLIRQGQKENIFVTFVYSPIKNKDGKVTKVAIWVLETTNQVTERQKVEAARSAFLEERNRLERFFMQAPVGICILSGPQLVFELVNPAYQQLFPGRELLNKTLLDALPEVNGAPIWDILQHVYKTGETFEGKELLIPLALTADGPVEDRYFNFIYQARYDENNQINGIMVIVFEVTGFVKVQQDLVEAREQSEKQRRIYETITSGTPDLMYVWDLDYHFTYANSALLTMWGKTWDTAIGKTLLENGYEPWHAEMHEREIDHVKATKESVRGEVSFPHAVLGKRVYDYILIPVLNEQGEVEAVAGTTRDVTERKQWEQDLAQSSEELHAINEEMAASNEELATTNEELLQIQDLLREETAERQSAIERLEMSEQQVRSIVAAAPFPIGVYTGREMRILMANQAIMDVWGKGNQVVGQTYHEVLPELADSGIYQQLDDVYTSGKPVHARNQRVDLVVDGILQPYYFNYNFTPLFDADGQVYGVMNTAAELTDLVLAKIQVEQSEAELRETKRRLEEELETSRQVQRQKDDFIGMASHELKTPLTSLNAIIQVANAKLKVTEDTFLAGAMDKANQQVKRMTTMINGFLNVSRLESGKIHIEKQPFRMAALLNDMIDEAAMTASTHHIELHDCPELEINADREKIGSVISNLISNAIKYSPKGTNIKINCTSQDNEVTVSVTDQGIGIKPQDIAKIFDRYYRVETDHTRHISGFGIGLYLSAEIIERHNGRIWAESESGEGSTFYFSLPLK